MITLDHLSRYASIVDDIDAFLAAAERPLDRVIWANPLRVDPQRVGKMLAKRCPAAIPLRWRPYSWRLPPETKLGFWPEHVLGWFHVQEEVALLAGDVLDAQPGERILDLCAAPGGKAVQVGVAMQDQGTLVANDSKYGRLTPLRRTLDRLGVTCGVVTHNDGKSFPDEDGSYDRVMADVPCTCEGTSRKSRQGRRVGTEPSYRFSIVQIQTALLRRALRLVKPGGVVVYATCTYAPEENEGVLTAALKDGAKLEKIEVPDGLRTAPGITQWGDRYFRDDIQHAIRLWPHHNDTGGFFIARIRRL